jgi:microcystin-dependent protein
MSTPFLGEIRMFAGNYAPAGWQLCDGRLLPIVENEALFAIIGTYYGGDGEFTFALPDLRGRVPVHTGNGSVIVHAEMGGEERVTLTTNQLPVHTHALIADPQPAESGSPEGRALSETDTDIYRASGAPTTALAPNTVLPVGGSQPHENMQPFLAINFIIALTGIFPNPI